MKTSRIQRTKGLVHLLFAHALGLGIFRLVAKLVVTLCARYVDENGNGKCHLRTSVWQTHRVQTGLMTSLTMSIVKVFAVLLKRILLN